MAKRKRTQYSDEFRASALLFLDAAGYPNQEGALSRVGNEIHVPLSTLRGWYTEAHNPVPADVRKRKRIDFVSAIQSELHAILGQMDAKRVEASYKDLATAFGILIDKKQLLDGKPTERVEHLETMLETLPPDEYDNIVREAEAIIASAGAGNTGSGSAPES